MSTKKEKKLKEVYKIEIKEFIKKAVADNVNSKEKKAISYSYSHPKKIKNKKVKDDTPKAKELSKPKEKSKANSNYNTNKMKVNNANKVEKEKKIIQMENNDNKPQLNENVNKDNYNDNIKMNIRSKSPLKEMMKRGIFQSKVKEAFYWNLLSTVNKRTKMNNNNMNINMNTIRDEGMFDNEKLIKKEDKQKKENYKDKFVKVKKEDLNKKEKENNERYFEIINNISNVDYLMNSNKTAVKDKISFYYINKKNKLMESILGESLQEYFLKSKHDNEYEKVH